MNNFTKSILGLIFLMVISCNDQNKPDRPNILLIMADDMGYSDIGCFGGEISTPTLDRLAENGIRFTHFYNTARCCPTRASLMTGLYPHESGIGHMTHEYRGPGYLGYLNDSCVTIAEVLKDAGYFTAMSGKWHAGAIRQSWPENRGFDRFFGIHHWVDSYFNVLLNCEIFENGKMVIPASDDPRLYGEQGKQWYTTDVFTTTAIRQIDEALTSGKPFFQYVAYNAPHWPLEAHDQEIEKYKDRYSSGYTQLRREKYERMKSMGIIDDSWALPEQHIPSWESHSDSAREDMSFRRAIYAAQVDILDQNIGRIVAHLEETGELENTLIFFLSDNGCSSEPLSNDYGHGWERLTKWNYDEWRDNPSFGIASQGRVWSETSNAPFRKNKRFTHEGGITTPFIVHWPDGVTVPGRIDRKPGHLVDIMATCLDVAGAVYPEQWNGIEILNPRGISLKKNFKGKRGEEHDMLFWEHEGHGALRKGAYKIVSLDPSDETLWELYNMENDRTETKDLSSEMPGLRAEMIDEWEKMAYETKAWPVRKVQHRNPVEK